MLIIENVAISNTPWERLTCMYVAKISGPVRSSLSDYMSASSLGNTVCLRLPTDGLVARHGKPMFLKIDIEGADKDCVLSVKHETASSYLSFEAHEDLEAMIVTSLTAPGTGIQDHPANQLPLHSES